MRPSSLLMRPAQPSSQKKRQTRRGCVVARRFVSIEPAVRGPANLSQLIRNDATRRLANAASYAERTVLRKSPPPCVHAPSQCTQDMPWHNAKQHLRLIALIGRLVKYPMARHDTARCSLSRADIVL
ncbi:hypothetical protein CDEST_05314 [Colletotrichum destructivum]|uniref:Uncharacterized protein n=1 Tax=Colletotrichum destructivum TaxID=34406 RepID=A0AAX4IAD1_9PEZI|nr:hypothetical protein CDEST_05314 [Colletotrichum destructivum]